MAFPPHANAVWVSFVSNQLITADSSFAAGFVSEEVSGVLLSNGTSSIGAVSAGCRNCRQYLQVFALSLNSSSCNLFVPEKKDSRTHPAPEAVVLTGLDSGSLTMRPHERLVKNYNHCDKREGLIRFNV